MSERLWQPLMLSAQIALAATILVAVIGVPLAYWMSRRSFRGHSIVDALLIVPLVLPPTVVGYFLLVLMGSRGPLGRMLNHFFGYSLIFNTHGAVIASATVALPLLYLPAKAAFASVDRELVDTARLLGASAMSTFWHVSLPLARRGIASGLLLAFARALGEFGATMMVLGDLPGKRTLPISIYDDYIAGELHNATPGVLALSGVSLVVILIYNRLPIGKSD
jgi:molybdate transport system permease protein